MFRFSSQIQILLWLALLLVFYWILDKFPVIYKALADNSKMLSLVWYRWSFSVIIAIFIIICVGVFTAFYQSKHRDNEVSTIRRTTISFLQIVAMVTFIALLSIYYIDNVQKIIYIIYGFFFFSWIIIGVANFMIDRRLEYLSRKDPVTWQPTPSGWFWERLFQWGWTWLFWDVWDTRYSESQKDNYWVDSNWQNNVPREQRPPFWENNNNSAQNTISNDNAFHNEESDWVSFDPRYNDDKDDFLSGQDEFPDDWVIGANEVDARKELSGNFAFSNKIILDDLKSADAFKF
jgi:hypothetical protein